MKSEDIKKFAEWLKQNEPLLDNEKEEYWELFAYRIVDYLEHPEELK